MKSLTLLIILSLISTKFVMAKAKKDSPKDVQTKSSKSITNSSKKDEKEYMATSNPLLISVGYLNLNFDKKIDDKSILGGEFAHFNYGGPLISVGLTALGLKYQRHFFGNALEDSMYLSGTGYVVNSRAHVLSVSASETRLFPGVATGYQWVWDRFAMKVGAGYSLTAIGLDFQVGAKF